MTDQQIPLVTIAIPTYNRASSYLPLTLKSALDQTYSRIEIVVSDNCSSDNTEQLVNSFEDSRVRYVRHAENIGAPRNWNFCIHEARGAYVLLLQDDDIIDPDFIDVCMTAANYRTNIGTIRTGMRLIDQQGNVIARQKNMVVGLSTEDLIFAWMRGNTRPYLCNTLLNAKKLQEIGGLNSRHNLFCDVIAAMTLSAQFGRVDVEDCKASARQHADERTFSAKIVDWCEDSLELLDLLCELVPDKRSTVREEGLKFFSRINYHRVKAVQASWKKVGLYFTVFKSFNYAVSPVTFLAKKTFLYRGFYWFARRVKRLVVSFVFTKE